ncbi:hypothetical protein [Spiroplasma tabanidicola]|uniref:hypothetical protein n=1 Tax=Spiroplasma tabanidicola TaxID=324079 RepID=UPI00147970A0|nr:hypothetical protein [Spiroplasma tabanidicola]
MIIFSLWSFEWFLTGWETICSNASYGGYTKNGGYSTHCLANANYICKIQDGLSYEESAPLFCAGVTTYKVLKKTRCKPGDYFGNFVIVGLVHMSIQYANAMG